MIFRQKLESVLNYPRTRSVEVVHDSKSAKLWAVKDRVLMSYATIDMKKLSYILEYSLIITFEVYQQYPHCICIRANAPVSYMKNKIELAKSCSYINHYKLVFTERSID